MRLFTCVENVAVWMMHNALVHMCGKCGSVDDAQVKEELWRIA